MPQYLAPGVYVEEVDTGIKTIEGVSTSVAGMVGVTRRGPTKGLPQLVTSFAEFERLYGGYFDFGTAFAGQQFLPHAVNGFFTNGGRQLYVMRVANGNASTGATAAQKQTEGGIVTRLKANASDGTTMFTPLSTRGIQFHTKVQLRMIKDGVTYDSGAVSVSAVDRTSGEVTVASALSIPTGGPTEWDARYTIVYTDRKSTGSLTNPTDTRENSILIDARDPGSWGRDITVEVADQAAGKAELLSNDSSTITLKSPSVAFYPNAWVEVDQGKTKTFMKVTAVNGAVITVSPAPGTTDFSPETPFSVTTLTVWEMNLTVSLGSASEQYSGLTLENVPGKYIVDRLSNSSLVAVSLASLTASDTDPLHFPAAEDGRTIHLDTGGADGTSSPAVTDYVGSGDPGNRTGIKALEDIDRISIIAAPGNIDVPVQNALIEQCERLKDRFAILDPKGTTVNDVTTQRQQFDTKYAAIYYPNLVVFDPVTSNNIVVPPSGHMAGIYARVDIERGVHKAPANEVVRGIVDFAATINKETQDLLNPSPTNINVFRDFRGDGRGLRIWGARVITSDTSWKYVNVRRLFLFLEESIDEGTQWVVFEPNDAPLWSRVTQSISAFLTRVWRDGALQGATAEEAFFVKCDRTTMTQDDIDNGKLIAIVGVAPVKPAEFVIIRISQWTAGASAA
ncbi:MAG: uncharacterized protein QOC81_1063 [Thermoanaerobaculia bacterium]|nr:uncharacterized protein [Thermoanaerobaculia bacterium]